MRRESDSNNSATEEVAETFQVNPDGRPSDVAKAYDTVVSDQKVERANEERGNRGPDEEPGFGQGA